MALKSAIFKAQLALADIDHGVYADHALTIARHPSETDERMMVRLLAFALYADAALVFGRGLSTEDEADLWQRDATGVIERWIDVGLPDERELRKACGRAREVVVVAYGARKVDAWWSGNAEACARLANLVVWTLTEAETAALQALAARSMTVAVTIQDGHVWFAGETATIELRPLRRL